MRSTDSIFVMEFSSYRHSDFWGLVMADFASFAQAEPQQLAAAIRAGIPPSLRGMVWQLMWVTTCSINPGFTCLFEK